MGGQREAPPLGVSGKVQRKFFGFHNECGRGCLTLDPWGSLHPARTGRSIHPQILAAPWLETLQPGTENDSERNGEKMPLSVNYLLLFPSPSVQGGGQSLAADDPGYNCKQIAFLGFLGR